VLLQLAELEVFQDGTVYQTYRLYAGITRIGRDPDKTANDIALEFKTVSTKHAEIGKEPRVLCSHIRAISRVRVRPASHAFLV